MASERPKSGNKDVNETGKRRKVNLYFTADVEDEIRETMQRLASSRSRVLMQAWGIARKEIMKSPVPDYIVRQRTAREAEQERCRVARAIRRTVSASPAAGSLGVSSAYAEGGVLK